MQEVKQLPLAYTPLVTIDNEKMLVPQELPLVDNLRLLLASLHYTHSAEDLVGNGTFADTLADMLHLSEMQKQFALFSTLADNPDYSFPVPYTSFNQVRYALMQDGENPTGIRRFTKPNKYVLTFPSEENPQQSVSIEYIDQQVSGLILPVRMTFHITASDITTPPHEQPNLDIFISFYHNDSIGIMGEVFPKEGSFDGIREKIVLGNVQRRRMVHFSVDGKEKA